MGPGAEYFHPVTARRTLAEGRFSAVLLMASGISEGTLSLVEHPLAPRAVGLAHTYLQPRRPVLLHPGRAGRHPGGRAGICLPNPAACRYVLERRLKLQVGRVGLEPTADGL